MTALIMERERIVRPREHLIAGRLRRFAWRHREAVSALTRRHPRLADLALSFPALLFALAVPRPRFDPEPVIERVIAGAPLSELAKDANVPMWTRRLMPEAFMDPLLPLPDGELFRRQIANHRPSRPKLAQPWLKAVATTTLWGADNLAIWYARHIGDLDQEWESRNWRLICLWAWHCEHPETPAHSALGDRWSPEMSPSQARLAAEDWAESVRVLLALGDRCIEDPWAEPAIVDGYQFEPVRTAQELITHARALHNCAQRFAAGMAADRERIWIVKRNGVLAAMLNIYASEGCPYPQLGQLSGLCNDAVPPDTWLAAIRWLRTYAPLAPVQPKPFEGTRPEAWRRMWRAYWLAKRRIPSWLPLAPGERPWRALMRYDD